LVPHAHPRFRRYRNFARDWATEQNMPSIIFIEPEYTDGPHFAPNDDHPPTGISRGQAFVADVYSALTANRVRWARTLLLVTYHEHGGFFDHVSPLNSPTPLAVHGPTSVFLTTGVRVPGFVISPLVDPATVYSGPLDHTSILQLLADKYAGGLYSPEVAARQPSLSRLSDALTRTAPRLDLPEPQCASRGGSGSSRAASAGCQRQCRGLPAGRRKNGR
jgi:phospholipase C